MASEWFRIKGEPDRKLAFAVERLRDGAFHHPDCDAWRKPQGRAGYARMEQAAAGRYKARLPELDPEQDYCVHVVDADTQQLVVSQPINGERPDLTTPRTEKDRRVGPVRGPTQPIPDLGQIVAGIRHLAAHWIARVWAERQYRNLGIGAVCVLAALVLLSRGPGREDAEQARVFAEQRAIRLVIDEDRALGHEIGQKVGIMDQYWDGSALVAELSDRMDAVDLGGCPQDFQLAYKRHVAAWGAVARVKAGNEGLNGAVKGFFTAGLAVIPAMSAAEEAMKEVQSSWSEVQQAAIRHGVAP